MDIMQDKDVYMDQNALLVSILPTTVHSAMATPQDSIQLNVFDPPRPYIDDDAVFPEGTIVTHSDDDDLQIIFVKKRDGSYKVEVSSDPYLVMVDFPFYGTHFSIGVIATIFDPATGALLAEYVKQPGDRWKLASPTDTAAVVGGRRIEILPQAKFNAQQPPDVPVLEYGDTRLSDILQDQGASVGDAERAAYDVGIVKSKKLSLRLLFPKIKYQPDRPQFTVRFGNDYSRVITRGKLAAYIAEELRTALAKAAQEGMYLHQADGTRVEFDRLVLIDVAFPSKASIQPRIGVICGE
ncbi:hypothetical protein VTO73DRAFT_11333 [Trametes versicolor]